MQFAANNSQTAAQFKRLKISREKKRNNNEIRTYFDGEVRRKSPNDGVMLGSSFPSGTFASLEQEGAHFQGAIDETSLIQVRRQGVEKPLE